MASRHVQPSLTGLGQTGASPIAVRVGLVPLYQMGVSRQSTRDRVPFSSEMLRP